MALNWKISLPTKESHPDFPLWALGYTPEDVYDLFFPSNFRFLCNPNRPAVCGRFGLPSDRLWRFEFIVWKDENGDEMAQTKNVESVVFPYITHPGSRYGYVLIWAQPLMNGTADYLQAITARFIPRRLP